MISVYVNGRERSVRSTATVLQACEVAGVDLPRFCYHPHLSVSGNCRRCLVEVTKSPKPVVACARPVAKGRRIYTDTPLVRKAREAVLEFLLLNHPLDCPICDQGGECDLQEEALTYGMDRGRAFSFKRGVEDKECGPIIKTIRTRCIHCTRCVRFAAEVAGSEILGAFGRGEDREIGTYLPSLLRTELSGNLVDLCPVGALTSKPYAYRARPWELTRVEGIDFFDAVATPVVYARANAAGGILRVLPRPTTTEHGNWISDRSRYAFSGLTRGRLTRGVTPFEFANLLDSSFVFNDTSKGPILALVCGRELNLERVAALSTFRSTFAEAERTQGESPASICVDSPLTYSLSRGLNGFRSITALLRIGTSPRWEASALSTVLRREAMIRPLRLARIGAFSSTRLSNLTHNGSSVRSLVALLEGRTRTAGTLLRATRPFLLLGVESLRAGVGQSLESLTRRVGRRLYAISSEEGRDGVRLGLLHSSLTSLAFAHMGVALSPHVSRARPLSPTRLFLTSKGGLTKGETQYLSPTTNTVLSHSTHRTPFGNTTTAVSVKSTPLVSLFERTGTVRTVEGTLVTHGAVLSGLKKGLTTEGLLSSRTRVLGEEEHTEWLSNLWEGEEEWTTKGSVMSKTSSTTSLQPRKLARRGATRRFTSTVRGRFTLSPCETPRAVRDFYLGGTESPIAAASAVRGECSLFLGRESNFSRER